MMMMMMMMMFETSFASSSARFPSCFYAKSSSSSPQTTKEKESATTDRRCLSIFRSNVSSVFSRRWSSSSVFDRSLSSLSSSSSSRERETENSLKKFKKLSPNEREKRRLFTLYTNPKLLLYIFFCGRKRTFSLLIKTIEELSLPKKECRIILRYFSIFFRGREKGRERER